MQDCRRQKKQENISKAEVVSRLEELYDSLDKLSGLLPEINDSKEIAKIKGKMVQLIHDIDVSRGVVSSKTLH